MYGGRSSLCQALKAFEDKTAAGAALDESILCLVKRIPCPEAAPLFDAIAGSRLLGNRILQVLRQSLLMVSDLLAITRDISSDVSQKRLESTVMSMMPVAVIWSLHLTIPSYLEPAFSNPWGSLLMLAAFVLTVTGYCLGGLVISRSIYYKTRETRISSPSSLSSLAVSVFSASYQAISPMHLRRFRRFACFFQRDTGFISGGHCVFSFPIRNSCT